MNIIDVICNHCGTAYTAAVSEVMPGEPGHFDCRICGDLVASWSDHRLHVFRLVVPSVASEHFPSVIGGAIAAS